MIGLELALDTLDSDEVPHDLHFQDKPPAISKQEGLQLRLSTTVQCLIEAPSPEVCPGLKLTAGPVLLLPCNPVQILLVCGLNHPCAHILERSDANPVNLLFKITSRLLQNEIRLDLTDPELQQLLLPRPLCLGLPPLLLDLAADLPFL